MRIDELLSDGDVFDDAPALREFIRGKVVLVTGAGGSIGSGLCRRLVRLEPARLVALGRSEQGLFELDAELRAGSFNPATVVADICCPGRIRAVFDEHRPDIVIHAAAHKHVPLMEANPGEAIRNNVLGTEIVALAAHVHRASCFVLISTDKAVNPVGVMGLTKFAAEMRIRTMPHGHTRFVVVRFGNVFGSSGSVGPIFAKQIAAGGPVTVTHPEMTRYFMSIPEACQLVLEAARIGRDRRTYIFDMGEPVKIADLATVMIRRTGADIAITYAGVRPGEKITESLADDGAVLRPTEVSRVLELDEPPCHIPQSAFDNIYAAIDASTKEARRQLFCNFILFGVGDGPAMAQTQVKTEPASVPAA